MIRTFVLVALLLAAAPARSGMLDRYILAHDPGLDGDIHVTLVYDVTPPEPHPGQVRPRIPHAAG